MTVTVLPERIVSILLESRLLFLNLNHWTPVESIEAILTASFEEEPLEAYFWEQSTVLAP
jgi:hypothetical protein